MPANGVILRRQWPLCAILLCCAAWFSIIATRGWMQSGGRPELPQLLDLATALVPSVIVALFAATLVRHARRRPDLDQLEARLSAAGSGTIALEARLVAVNATLGNCLDRTEQLAETASDRGRGLAASAAALTTAAVDVVRAGSEADRSAANLLSAMPELARQAGEVDAVVRKLGLDSGQQVGAVETMLATVRMRGDEAAGQADAAIAGMTRLLIDIDERSKLTTTSIAKRAYALDAAVDGVLARATALLDSVGERAATQGSEMEARLAAARGVLDQIGEQGARAVGQRLDLLITAGGHLRHIFDTHDAQSLRLIERTDDT